MNLCKKTFIHGYDFSDLKNECYKSLFYCVSKYNTETHRFVAYATNGIKNNIYDLVRKSQTRKSLDSSETLIITDEFQETLVSDLIGIEDFLCKKSDYIELHKAIKNLNADEQEMINFLFFSNTSGRKTIKEYSHFKNISYHCAVKRRKTVLKKLSKVLGSIDD